MLDARHYEAAATLRNGQTVVVRAVRASDKAAMLATFHGLEPDTIYLRFFGAHGEPSADELRQWTELDFTTTVRLVVCIPGPARDRIIGGATYVMLDAADPAAGAEISFTVEEDFQGQGLASQLLNHLARIARAAGITRFVADTLPANGAMLHVFSKSGLPMTRERRDDVVHVVLALSA